MELADKLAAAQTETAARVLTLSWNESGCAQKAAGRGAQGSVTTKRPPPTATPDIWVNARLKGRWKDLLASYAKTQEGKQHGECLVYAYSNYAGANETKTLYHHASWFTLSSRDYWSIEVTGPNCQGIQTWYIDDDTGAVTFEGSSLGDLVRPTKTPTPPTKTPIPTDCVRVETTDARLDSSWLLHLHWRITNICNIPISSGQTIVFYDKDKNMLGSKPWDSFPSLKLLPMDSKLYRTFVGYQFAGGDAFHSYEIEAPWTPN
jgi:hypothetical protein